jgi:hypothetical protein
MIVSLHLKQVLRAIRIFFKSWFCVFARSEGRAYSLNAREVAPAATNPEEFANDRSALKTGKQLAGGQNVECHFVKNSKK